MVSALTWVLLGIGFYWVALIWLRRQDLLPSFVGTQGPLITLHTKRFRDLIDRVASPKRFWRAWGNVGLGVALVFMAGTFAFFIYGALQTARNPPQASAINQPRNVLAIPGLNDFLPLSVAPEIVLGLAIGIVVHEGGHGVMCRVGDIDIESMGLVFLAILPMGAFVEPDEESRRRTDRGVQSRMFAAGVMNNFVITIVAFALLFGPVVGLITFAGGAPVGAVLPGSAAATAGLAQGDRIVGVDGHEISNASDLEATLSEIEASTVRVDIAGPDGNRTETIERATLVTGIAQGSPFYEPDVLEDGARIRAVNDTEVHTEEGFRQAMAERRVAILQTAANETVTGAVGAVVTVVPGDPLDDAGAPARDAIVVTTIGGDRIVSADDLSRVLEGTEPNTTVDIEAIVDGSKTTYQVRLGQQDHHGYLGVLVAPGVSGLRVNDFGIEPYPAETYLTALGGNGGGGLSFLERIWVALRLPLAGLIGALTFNIPGFTDPITNFYTVAEPFTGVPWVIFGLANALFWTGWINFNLAVFNCIPAFPLDGGHLLRASAEAVISRLPVPRRRAITSAVTTSVGLSMLFAVLVTLFGPQFL